MLESRTQEQYERKEDREVEGRKMLLIEGSSESGDDSEDAFSVLKRGSLKHKKTHDFIEKVQKIYQLPIKGKPQKDLIRNSSNSVLDPSMQVNSEELEMVDCLADAFDPKKL